MKKQPNTPPAVHPTHTLELIRANTGLTYAELGGRR